MLTDVSAADLDLSVDAQDAEGVLTSDRITETDILDGRWDNAAVEVWRVEGRRESLQGATGQRQVNPSHVYEDATPQLFRENPTPAKKSSAEGFKPWPARMSSCVSLFKRYVKPPSI